MHIRTLFLVGLLIAANAAAQTAESCMTIHGRLHYYGGDANLRIWHIGTHHMFTPDETTWDKVLGWLDEKATAADKKNFACANCAHDLYADFLICPTEPYKKGSVQRAKVISATNRRYVPTE
jgi:hypothetical protein